MERPASPPPFIRIHIASGGNERQGARRETIVLALIVSGLIHGMGLSVLAGSAWLTWDILAERARLPGRPHVVTITSFQVDDRWPEGGSIESPASPVMTVTPHEANVDQERFFDSLSAAPALAAAVNLDLPLSPPVAVAEFTVSQRAEMHVRRAAEHTSTQMALARSPSKAPPPDVSFRAAVVSQSLGHGDVPPNFSGNRPPHYPDEARRNGWQGTVLLRLHVSATGAINQVEVERGSGHILLDAAAAAAVRTWRGVPAMRQGRPVASVELQEVRFRLP